MRNLLFVFCSLLCFLITTSCSSKESEAKGVVKSFCEAYKSNQTDKASTLYPEFKVGEIKVDQIDLTNLQVTQKEDMYEVEDGANHIFYVVESDGKFIIKDSRNVILWKSKYEGDIKDIEMKAAVILGMVSDKSADLERIKAYSLLQDGSDLINFLKLKYPKALVYDVTVENVRKSFEYDYLIVKSTLKSGNTKPLRALTVNFIFKDKEGNEITREDCLADLEANSSKVVEQMVNLSDYPNIKDVSIELEPFSVGTPVPQILLLCAYANISKKDYQEYLNTKK